VPIVADADFRILSWNMHGLRDDRAALTRIVRDADPDVVSVQEAPKGAASCTSPAGARQAAPRCCPTCAST
jgi:exonuclease III